MSMLLRRGLMGVNWAANGWNRTVITATEDTLRGDATTAVIQSHLPAQYRYAIALRDDMTNLENNAMIAEVFLKSRSAVLGLRIRDGVYGELMQAQNSTYDLILRAGETVNLYWRTDPIGNDEPLTSWDYATIQPGALENAKQLGDALSSISDWSLMIAIADLDFSVRPGAYTFAAAFAKYNSNVSGAIIRVNAGGTDYQSVIAWLSSYGAIVSADTKIACFYI